MASVSGHSTLLPEFERAALNLSSIPSSKLAHCIIDVQRRFCDPDYDKKSWVRGDEQTARLAEHIAEIAPLFRAAAVPTYMIYYKEAGAKPPEKSYDRFFKVTAQKGDIIVGKNRDSAFAGSNIRKHFKRHGTEILLISGVNISACVRSTVLDALERKFKVCLLEDCIGDELMQRSETARNLNKMIEGGAVLMRSHDVLAQIRPR